MGLNVACVEWNTTTGISNVPKTSVGFQPKVGIYFGVALTAAGQGADPRLCIGWAVDATHRGFVTWNSQDNVATTVSKSRIHDDGMFGLMLNNSSTLDGELDHVSFDSDGQTYVPDNAFSLDFLFRGLLLGGSDLTNVACGSLTIGAGIGNYSVTSLTFKPDCMLFLTTKAGNTLNGSASGSGMSFGWALSATARGCLAWGSADGNAGTNTKSIFMTNRCLAFMVASSATLDFELDFVSNNNDGFTVNKPATSNTGTFLWLALKGPRFAMGTVPMQQSAGNFSIASLPFGPLAWLFAATMKATATQSSCVDGAELCVGAAVDSTHRASIWVTDDDALNPSDNQQRYDNARMLMDYQGAAGFALDGDVDFVSNNSDGGTFNEMDANPTAYLAHYLAIGPAAIAAADPFVTVQFRAA